MLDFGKSVQSNKSGEIRLRQGANRSEVRPRTAEQGFGAAWSRGPACGDAFAEPNVGALLLSRIQAHLPGQIPIHGAPLPPCGAPRARGCAPDPVRVAPVREGAHKAAIDIREAGRIASAPASGPSANGSQPHPVAGCLRTGTNAGLHTPSRSHPQRGPCSALRCAHLARICNGSMRRILAVFCAANCEALH
jgi:hypothetical protein